MDEITAIGRARTLVKEIASPPVDAVGIAQGLGFEVRRSTLLASDQAGNTFEKDGRRIICVNENDDPYRQRFTVLHEVGHHVLDLPSRHGAIVPAAELERFSGRPLEEKLCDAFAAACLVPVHLMRPMASEMPFSVETVHSLTDLFQASHQCIASSYVRASRELLAYAYAEQGRILHVIASPALRDARIYIDRGCKVPANSAAALALSNGSRCETTDLDGTDWSNSPAAGDYACYEEALHMQAWEQTLSLMTFEVGGKSSLDPIADYDDKELLPELTGHLPWPRR